MSLQRILDEGTIEINEPDEFSGYWNGNHIWVKRVSDENWYIQVRAQDGCYVYDGYWPTDRHAGVKEAVDEAFKGAMLIGEHDAHQARE